MNLIIFSILLFYPLNPFQHSFKKGRVSLGLDTYFLSSEKYYDYYRNVNRGNFKFMERRFSINGWFQVTENFSIWMSLPWVWRELTEPYVYITYSSGEIEITPYLVREKRDGLGDIWGGVEYFRSVEWINGGAFIVMKFPTGKEGFGENSIPIGTGQFDLGIGLRGGIDLKFVKGLFSLMYLWRNSGNPPYMIFFPLGVGKSVDPGDQLWIDSGLSFNYAYFETGVFVNAVLRRGDEYRWFTLKEGSNEIVEHRETFVRSNSYYIIPFIGVSGKNFLARVEFIFPVSGASYPVIPTFPYTYNLPWYPSSGVKTSIWYLF